MTRLAALLAIALLPACVASTQRDAQVVRVTAKRFEFSPDVIRLRAGVPVVLELTSLDRKHGFAVPDLGIDEEISPGAPTLVRLTPERAGTYPFHCSVFCGEGHEGMAGRIVVEP
jgi:cytochrome c oxidase subunit 2